MPNNPSTWERDFAVLREVVRRLGDPNEYSVRAQEVAAALGLTWDDVVAAAGNLERGGYVSISKATGPSLDFRDYSERALRETGVWPNDQDAGNALLWVLEQKVETASTPEERSRWVKIRDAIGGAGKDFAVELAAAMSAKLLGA